MDTDHSDLTPAQAREQLAAAQPRPLTSARDRRVHAIGTAVAGLTVGFFMAASLVANNIIFDVEDLVVMAVYVALILGVSWWMKRAARTVPRRVRLISSTGLGATVVVAVVALNVVARTLPITWPIVLLTGLMAAVPSLLAAGVIAAGRR